jgi:hypothetical protein
VINSDKSERGMTASIVYRHGKRPMISTTVSLSSDPPLSKTRAALHKVAENSERRRGEVDPLSAKKEDRQAGDREGPQ